MSMQGIWLPIITPFKYGKVDFASYQAMIEYYIKKGISGIIPLGTTGESPALSEEEMQEIIEKTIEYVQKRVPIYVGAGGNNTSKVVKQVQLLEKYDIEGVLSVSPYYNRPSQEGIYQHFKAIAEATSLNIIVYNIPYRTGRNIENQTIHRLAELKNIVALKDACGDIKQTMALLMERPADLAILTGEDILFYMTTVLGGDGGILASAHLKTETFIEIYTNIQNNNQALALENWKKVYPIIPLLFEEPNPAPIKYWLSARKLIDTCEVRLPLTDISDQLRAKLNKVE
ncbi:MAG: dapA2 [Firmicutes bacterium]|nr:dapA2 [Bacillota bacterium]